MKRILALGIVAILSYGCADVRPRTEHTVVSNVVRIFMHQPDDYTFFVKTGGDKIGKLSVRVYGGVRSVEIIEDAKQGEPMVIEYTNCGSRVGCVVIPENFSYWSVNVDYLKIHLHSSSEVDGGGWEKRVGKRTIKGNTVVVE